MMTDTMRVLITAVIACGLSAVLGRLLLPVLHALKAGASIRELGPPGTITRLALPSWAA